MLSGLLVIDYEQQLRELGVVEKGWFKTAAGSRANQKVNLEIVHGKNPALAAEIAGMLAVRLCTHGRPDLIVPIPDGANPWGQDVALYMGAEMAQMCWLDKKTKTLGFSSPIDREKVENAQKIAIVDDVFTTGSSIELVSSFDGISGKVVVAGVVWKRSENESSHGLPLVSVVDTPVALIED